MAIHDETIRALEALETEDPEEGEDEELRDLTVCWTRNWCWKSRFGG